MLPLAVSAPRHFDQSATVLLLQGHCDVYSAYLMHQKIAQDLRILLRAIVRVRSAGLLNIDGGQADHTNAETKTNTRADMHTHADTHTHRHTRPDPHAPAPAPALAPAPAPAPADAHTHTPTSRIKSSKI